MAKITDPSVARAIRDMAIAARQVEAAAQDALDLAGRQLAVANAMHDLLINAEQEEAAYHTKVQSLRSGRAS